MLTMMYNVVCVVSGIEMCPNPLGIWRGGGWVWDARCQTPLLSLLEMMWSNDSTKHC